MAGACTNSYTLALIFVFALLPSLPGFGRQTVRSGARASTGVPEEAGQRSTGVRRGSAEPRLSGFRVAGAVPPGVLEKMRREGVNRANIRTEFAWRGSLSRGRPTHITVSAIAYFSEYANDCSQIDDSRQLERIRASGLEAELKEVAVERTRSAHWLFIDKPPRHVRRGGTVIYVFADGRVPPGPDILGPEAKPADAFGDAAGMDDVRTASVLLKRGVSADSLRFAFWASLGKGHSCLLRLLLNSGVDQRGRDRWGNTPLMVAVGNDALGAVRVLLAAEADVNARNFRGETALSIANRYHHEEIVRLLTEAGARH